MPLPSYSTFDRIKSLETHWTLEGQPIITIQWASNAYLSGSGPTAPSVPAIYYGVSPNLNAAQQDVAKHSFNLWADLIQPSLVVGSDPLFGRPDITLDWAPLPTTYAGVTNSLFSFAKSGLPFSYSGSSLYKFISAPVVISSVAASNNGVKTDDYRNIISSTTFTDIYGGYSLTTQIHEIGHALGLSHTGYYNGTVGVTGPTYLEDNDQYTVMSYYMTSNWRGYHPQTPMLDDILAIQHKYGSNPSTRLGLTVYGFNSTANDIVYDFTINRHPILTIYDAGGYDVLDLSGFSVGNTIDLNLNKFSSVNGLQNNVALASNIEKYVSGLGGDTVYTNGVLGSEVVSGFGSDTFYSGGARDTFIFNSISGKDVIYNFKPFVGGVSTSYEPNLFSNDHIEFSKSVFSDFASIMQSISDDGLGNLNITKGTGSIKIVGLTKSQVNTDWFQFTPVYTPQSTGGSIYTLQATINRTAFGAVTNDPHSVGGEIYALYDGLLGRAPDALGLRNWAASLESGAPIQSITEGFLNSAEGKARTGAADNATFVEQLYQANLHRASDPIGKTGWVGALDHGTSRADVALGFALSDEHTANLKSVFDAGVFVPDPAASNVARLYYAVLNRAPDGNELLGGADALKAGTSMHDLSTAHLGSVEYQVLTTGLINYQFVDNLYQRFLGRESDIAGVQNWTAVLDQGIGRTVVANAFTDSLEFQGKYAGQSSAAYVEGLYEHILGRTGDSAGLQGWMTVIDSKLASRTDVAHGFTSSVEFQAKYVGPSNADFVDELYENALGRHADAGGLQGWTDVLARGTSRADVAVAIAQSTEAQQHLVSVIEEGWHLT